MENMTNNNTTEYMIGVWILTILAPVGEFVFRGEPGETLPEVRKRVANHLTKIFEMARPKFVNPKFWLTSGGFVCFSHEKWTKVANHPHGGYWSRTLPDIKCGYEARQDYVPATLDEDYRLVPVTD